MTWEIAEVIPVVSNMANTRKCGVRDSYRHVFVSCNLKGLATTGNALLNADIKD